MTGRYQLIETLGHLGPSANGKKPQGRTWMILDKLYCHEVVWIRRSEAGLRGRSRQDVAALRAGAEEQLGRLEAAWGRVAAGKEQAA